MSNVGKTCSELGINKGTWLGPENGWKPSMYYIVEVASSSVNNIHKVIFYSGFLSKDKQGNEFPCGYNCLLSPVYDNNTTGIRNTYYMKVLEELNLNLK